MRALFGLLLLACVAASPPAAAQAPTPGVEEARAALDEALADPRFHRWERDRVLDAPDRVVADGELAERVRAWLRERVEAVGESVRRFFRRLNRGGPASSSGGGGSWFPAGGIGTLFWWLGVAVCVLVAAALLWVAVLAVRSRRPRRRRPPAPAALAAALRRGGALEAEADEWIDHAEGLAAEDLRLAYRAMYLALLAGLHRRGWIRFAASRTNGSYVRGFRGPSGGTGPDADGPRASFARLTALFDDVWYGHEPPDAAGFPAVRERVRRLLGEEAS